MLVTLVIKLRLSYQFDLLSVIISIIISANMFLLNYASKLIISLWHLLQSSTACCEMSVCPQQIHISSSDKPYGLRGALNCPCSELCKGGVCLSKFTMCLSITPSHHISQFWMLDLRNQENLSGFFCQYLARNRHLQMWWNPSCEAYHKRLP